MHPNRYSKIVEDYVENLVLGVYIKTGRNIIRTSDLIYVKYDPSKTNRSIFKYFFRRINTIEGSQAKAD